MNVAAARSGRRHPAYCASGGRAIMSQMPESEVEALLDSRSLHALTPMTIVDRARILELVEQARLDGFSVTNQEVLLGEIAVRSEEHTSELQSLMRNSYAVFCLKKQKK